MAIYVQCARSEGLAPIKRSVLADVFGRYAAGRNGDIAEVRYSDRDRGEVYGGEDEEMPHLSFNGGGANFMQAIWEIANRTNSSIFWLGSPPNLAVTSTTALEFVPEGVLEAIGPARIVRSGKELVACMMEGE